MTTADQYPVRFYLLLASMIVAGVLVLWTQNRNLSKVRELRKSADSTASSRFHNSARLEARLRKINSLYFRFSLGILPNARPDIEKDSKELTEWLAAQEKVELTPAEQDAFQRVAALFQKYVEHSQIIFQRNIKGDELREWRRIKEDLFAELLTLAGELKEADEDALRDYLQANQKFAAQMERSLVISSLLLIGFGVLLALVVIQGLINPLRASVEQSRAILERQEKLSALGMLAAGVAHEIRNPLNSIKARLFTQKALLPAKSEEWEDNIFIAEEITRLERIVRDILAFARPAAPELKPVALSQSALEVTELLKSEFTKDSIEVTHEFRGELTAQADPQQLKQILINLLKNAAESAGPGGRIVIRGYRNPAVAGSNLKAFVVLEVEDNGKGVPAEARGRLFDPFFTTKAHGTGLGLSTAARILEAHGGTIEFKPATPHGAIFRILIPEYEAKTGIAG